MNFLKTLIVTIETEKNNEMSFLDINVIREQEKRTSKFNRKPTFSDAWTQLIAFYLAATKLI